MSFTKLIFTLLITLADWHPIVRCHKTIGDESANVNDQQSIVLTDCYLSGWGWWWLCLESGVWSMEEPQGKEGCASRWVQFFCTHSTCWLQVFVKHLDI